MARTRFLSNRRKRFQPPVFAAADTSPASEPDDAGVQALLAAAAQDGSEQFPQVLESSSDLVAVRALRQLGDAQGEEYVPALVSAARSPSQVVSEAALEALARGGLPRHLEALVALSQEAEDHSLRKAARRWLHRLRGRGIALPEPTRESGASFGRPTFILAKSAASDIDSRGNRLVWIAASGSLGGSVAMTFFINERDGIQECLYQQGGKKRAESLLDTLRDVESLWADMPPEYARRLVLEAERRTEEQGGSLPPDFVQCKEILGDTLDAAEQPLVYQRLSQAEITLHPRYRDETQLLLEDEPITFWPAGLESLASFGEQLNRVDSSSLVLLPQSEQGLEQDILERAIKELLSNGDLALLKRRLEEMSYIYLMNGKELAAKRALAAALDIGDSYASVANNRFVQNLVRVALQVQARKLEAEQETTREHRRLYLPGRGSDWK